MDFTVLTEYFELVVVLACLIVGYIIKNTSFLKFIQNNDIPMVLAVLGALLNVLVNGLSVDSVVFGALMGLASTGMHQTFKRFVENTKEE